MGESQDPLLVMTGSRTPLLDCELGMSSGCQLSHNSGVIFFFCSDGLITLGLQFPLKNNEGD